MVCLHWLRRSGRRVWISLRADSNNRYILPQLQSDLAVSRTIVAALVSIGKERQKFGSALLLSSSVTL
jgi:hypothetical protein